MDDPSRAGADDPTRTDPDKYRPIFENDLVRVLGAEVVDVT